MANWDTAGNAASAGNFLGTTNPQPLVLKAGGNEQIRVQATGNVGNR